MISQPVTESANGRVASLRGAPRTRRPGRRLLLVGAALLVVGLVIAAVVWSRASTTLPSATEPSTTAPAVIHGQIVPMRMARVGTITGGVVRQLVVSPGAQLVDRAALAWIESSAGTEILSAPFEGTVTNVFVHVGDTVLPGTTVAVVADLRTLQVETTDVDQFLVAHVRPGDVVPVTVDAIENLTLRGTVRSVAGFPQADASTIGQTYPMVVDLGAPPRDVRAGMTVRITLPN